MRTVTESKIYLLGAMGLLFVLFLAGCSNAGFAPAKKQLNGTEQTGASGGVTNPTAKVTPFNPEDGIDPKMNVDPVNPGTDSVAPQITIATSSDRINYSNYSSIQVSGNCDEKNGIVKVLLGENQIASAVCDGTQWSVDKLSDLSSVAPGVVTVRAELSDAAGNKGTATATLTRAPSDRGFSLTVTAATKIVRNKLKVFLIIDNSGSMKDEQARLAAGISKLTDSLKQYDVEFIVYTTSVTCATPGSVKCTAYGYRTYSWIDPSTGTQMKGVTAPAVSQYKIHDWSALRSPYARKSFSSAMSDLEFNSQRDSLSATISSLGINGSGNEAGLLSMAHILAAEDFNATFAVSPSSESNNGDKVVFLIVTDNDDQSATEPNGQFKDYVRNYAAEVVSTSAWTAANSLAEATGQQASYLVSAAKVHYKKASVCNGDPCFAESDLYFPADPAKYGKVAVACSAELRAELGTSVLTADAVSCDYSAAYPRSVLYPSVSPGNICNAAFVMGGISYLNAYDFQLKVKSSDYQNHQAKNFYPVPGSCSVSYKKYIQAGSLKATLESSQSIENALSSGQSSVLADALKMKLESRFGKQGYLVSGIINRLDMGTETCRAQAEGVGTRYLQFLNGLGAQGYSNTICLDDYSSALSSVKEFAQKVVNKSMPVTLNALESIASVKIVRGGQEILLASADYSVSKDANNALFLNIQSASIQEGDVVKVEVRSL